MSGILNAPSRAFANGRNYNARNRQNESHPGCDFDTHTSEDWDDVTSHDAYELNFNPIDIHLL